MTYLLDTSVLIDALNGKRQWRALLEQLVIDGHVLASCPVTVAELLGGMRSGEEERTNTLLDSLEHYDLTQQEARVAGDLRRTWSGRGRTIPLPDLLIAAVTLTHQLVLITNNTKDFPMLTGRLFSRSR